MKIAIVVMASGFGKRYGSNKLLEEFLGRPLYQYPLELAAESDAAPMIVVTRFPEIRAYVENNYPEAKVIWNDHPEHGISESLRLGLMASGKVDGCCFMVSDQPLLKKESVQRMICQFRKNPSDIVVCSDGEKRGNPAIFPSDLFGELYQLTGDQGGRRVMVHHEELLTEIRVSSAELMDIDRVKDKRMLEAKSRRQ